ncbi:MAG: DNA polymerase III subunit gamma/tau [Microterricola sp.]
MTRDPDDDALSWAGDDDPTLSGGPTASGAQANGTQPELAPGWKVVGEPGTVSDGVQVDDGGAEGEPSASDVAAASSAALIVLGVLGGVYLLYTVGWVITAGRVPNGSADIVGGFMFDLGLWLAALAPALWFALSLWLTAVGSRWRLFWLLLGVLVLLPVPFIVGVGVGA